MFLIPTFPLNRDSWQPDHFIGIPFLAIPLLRMRADMFGGEPGGGLAESHIFFG